MACKTCQQKKTKNIKEDRNTLVNNQQGNTTPMETSNPKNTQVPSPNFQGVLAPLK